jgi:hypothetical protein
VVCEAASLGQDFALSLTVLPKWAAPVRLELPQGPSALRVDPVRGLFLNGPGPYLKESARPVWTVLPIGTEVPALEPGNHLQRLPLKHAVVRFERGLKDKAIFWVEIPGVHRRDEPRDLHMFEVKVQIYDQHGAPVEVAPCHPELRKFSVVMGIHYATYFAALKPGQLLSSALLTLDGETRKFAVQHRDQEIPGLLVTSER